MADLRVDSTDTTETYVATLSREGVTLPLSHSAGDCGVIVDANGRGIITVDVNNELPDDQVERIASWIILAVNTCGGFKAERRHG